MKKEKKHTFLLSVGIFFCAVAMAFGLIKLNIYGQNSPAEKNGIDKSIIFKTAANENAKLKNNLVWTLGAKTHRGWYIYVSLIQQTTGTEAEPETLEFARAVSVWQQKFGLSASGVIDSDTLLKLIESWQARRLKSSRFPSESELLNAPIADFYDQTRDVALLQVERETYAAYKKMIAAAATELNLKTTKTGELAPDERYLRIISAFRSREYQEKLRRESPDSGRAGLAVNSPHFTGRALDIYVGGEPTITKDPNRAQQAQTPAYKWLVKNAERFGFYPYYYEPWHWEYVR